MKRKILFDPHPRTGELIFTQKNLKRLHSLFDMISWEGERMPAEMVDKSLPGVFAVVGQTSLPRERLEKAGKLRAIINVEGNFLHNIDYEYCLGKGIYILNVGIAFSEAVAEMALGFALSLARGISLADRQFRNGKEIFGGASNTDSFLLKGKKVGIIGLGNVGKALLKLLEPFRMQIAVHDPWLPDNYINEMGAEPEPLDVLLKTARIIFVLAGATTENRAMLGKKELGLIGKGSVFILASRASLVDFDALSYYLKKGSFKAALDVFPVEPLQGDSVLREFDNVLLSGHRAGGIPEAYKLIGEMVVDDLELLLKNLSPVRLQRASLETVKMLSSKPVG